MKGMIPLKLRTFHQRGHSGDGRFIVTEGGKPFFYLGDTAWELFHRLSREEAHIYIRDRAAKGFTVIQAVVLAEFDGLTAPNYYGDLPLHDSDVARPSEAYFEHVDYIVEEASSLGLHIGMLPTWGDKVNKKWGVGPEIFTPQNALAYGEYLGRRYREGRIIWILGGDRPCENERHYAVWSAMAEGLRRGDRGHHLLTYHPMGGMTSAQFFHNEPWLDFNMLQSGHSARDGANYEMIARDYARLPAKPCLDGEARYEDHPINWDPKNGWFDDHDVRQAAYWAVFAGAFGHTYGCHDIWQFWGPQRPPVSCARTEWRGALQLPGASQMQHLRHLIESRPMLVRVPDQSLLASDNGKGPDHMQATRGADGGYAFVYMPRGGQVAVRMNAIAGQTVRAHWFNPRDGSAELIGEFNSQGSMKSIPAPSKGDDWVLVLDEATKQFPAPGALM
jgi:hypothetical protein